MMQENANNHQAAAAMVTTNVTVHFATKDLPVVCATPVDIQETARQCLQMTKGYLSRAPDTSILSKP